MARNKIRKRKTLVTGGLWGKLKSKGKVKDVLFRSVFGSNKQALLELYNLLNDTDYSDVEKLEIATIDSAIFITYKNDLSFVVSGVINLYEHQSTINPNMPVRFLIYLAEEYQRIIELSNRSIYGSALISLPTPKCVVFYNGEADMPDVQELQLSDAFENKDINPDLQLKVKVININYGHNRDIMGGCKTLEDYACFVSLVRDYSTQYDLETAIRKAIEYCIQHEILADFLREHRSEVLGMILRDFDKRKYEYTLREEGREEEREALLVALVKEGEITIESASKRLDMSPEIFKEKYLKDT